MVKVVGLPVQSLAYHLCVASSRPALENTKRCTRLAIVCDKVCQLPAQGRWFSPGTPVSSTSKTDRHDIAEILLKVALNPIPSIHPFILSLLKESKAN